MKFLHTGDWHVGRTIRGRPRDDEHRAVLGEIAAVAADEQVELILVAGDIFDTAAPAPAAEEIVYRALLDLASVAPVVIVAGNHDSPARLRAVAPLLELGRVTVCASVQRPDQGGAITIGGLPARIALIPFIGKRGIVRVEEILSLDTPDLIGEYADRVERIVTALCRDMTSDTVNIVLGHLMVLGGETGGGERTAHLFDYAISALAFPGHLSYVALGHLHRPQRVPAPAPVWYSGSPLQLDFGEGEDRKAVVLVEAEPGLPARVETRFLSAGRRLRTVRGTLADIAAIASGLGASGLGASGLGNDYLRVELEEMARVGLAEEVRDLLPEAVEIRLATSDLAGGSASPPRRLGRDPGELFREYLAYRRIDDPKLVAFFDELVAASHETDGPGADGYAT
ncbi:MAG TPA: exonuclease SbcCD subunit D [Acidimicrobiia bacterium]|nr:exonuclease SbcCD subunit D [Acidimicrobiia bacterium]